MDGAAGSARPFFLPEPFFSLKTPKVLTCVCVSREAARRRRLRSCPNVILPNSAESALADERRRRDVCKSNPRWTPRSSPLAAPPGTGPARRMRPPCRDGSTHNEPHDCALYARPRSLAIKPKCTARCNSFPFAARQLQTSTYSHVAASNTRPITGKIASNRWPTGPRGALHPGTSRARVQAGRRRETEL